LATGSAHASRLVFDMHERGGFAWQRAVRGLRAMVRARAFTALMLLKDPCDGWSQSAGGARGAVIGRRPHPRR